MIRTKYKAFQRKETIGNKEILVSINIPDNVRNRQDKINQIYEILKPSPPTEVKAIKTA